MAKGKIKLWSPSNFVRAFKSMAASVVSGGIAYLIWEIGSWLMFQQEMMIVGQVIHWAGVLFGLLLYGLLVYNWWNWK